MGIMELFDTYWLLNPKENKFTYCSSSGLLDCKGRIYLLSPQTFMLQLQNITRVMVIDMTINYK